jgi:hypothetical protein
MNDAHWTKGTGGASTRGGETGGGPARVVGVGGTGGGVSRGKNRAGARGRAGDFPMAEGHGYPLVVIDTWFFHTIASTVVRYHLQGPF